MAGGPPSSHVTYQRYTVHEGFCISSQLFSPNIGKSENWSTRLGPMNRVDGLLCDGDLFYFRYTVTRGLLYFSSSLFFTFDAVRRIIFPFLLFSCPFFVLFFGAAVHRQLPFSPIPQDV